MIVGAGIMVMRDEKILLGRRKSKLGLGTFGWVGGAVEDGEDVTSAAIRELNEETGMTADGLDLLSIQVIEIDGNKILDFEFLAINPSGEPELREPDKVDAWSWYSFSELPNPLFAPLDVALEAYRRRKPIISI